MTQTLLTNARIFDGHNSTCAEGMQVLVEEDLIRKVSAGPIRTTDATVIDLKGRTLMPGLIDAHIHAYASDLNVTRLEEHGETYRAAHA